MKVLICDDHLVFAESLACLLSRRGVEVVAVTHHPDDAITVLSSGSVDIALLDVVFGRVNVLDRLAAIRAAAPSTRLILLTGRVDDLIVSTARAGGVRGLVEKQQSSVTIMATIERVFAGKTVFPASQPEASTVHQTSAVDARRLTAFLTPRERDVLRLLVAGYDTATLARTFGVTQATARSHVQSMLIKLNVHSRLEAATMAVRFGIVDPQTGAWLL